MVGKSISHYLIEAELGRGGMGIVYRGQDTKLGRTVAIKVLPAGALASEDDRARFDREAKAAAALNHPNIAIVYEVDQATPSDAPHGTQPSSFIAMEYIEGESLEAKVKSGPLGIEDALRIAIEIASGLEAAHEKNIVHRDIKSANVMLTKKRVAKILDFGLAQTAQSTKLTQLGSTLGTVAFMSPEQARGEQVDLRTDIWALGTVLYEMIGGRHAFPGDYEQAVVYSILNEDPEPLTSIRSNVPVSIDWIVSKCLAKKAEARYQSTTELMVDLKAVDTSITSTHGLSRVTAGPKLTTKSNALSSVSGLTSTVKRTWPLMLAIGLVFLVIGYVISSGLKEEAGNRPLLKHVLHIAGVTDLGSPTVSPNSQYIAFTGRDSVGTMQLFVLDNATAKFTPIPGANGSFSARFSPDGSRLLYEDGTGTLSIYSLLTGISVSHHNLGFNPIWEDNSTLLYTDSREYGLRRFNLETKHISTVISPSTTGEDSGRYLANSIIPGTRMATGTIGGGPGSLSRAILIDLDLGSWDLIEDGLGEAKYVRYGFLSYRLEEDFGPIYVRRYTIGSSDRGGSQNQVIGAIAENAYDIGADGSFIYVPASLGKETQSIQLTLHDIENGSSEILHSAVPKDEVIFRPSYSPDGSKIALDYVRTGEGRWYVGVFDPEIGRTETRTFKAGRARARWAPNSKFIYYQGFDFNVDQFDQSYGIFKQPIDSPGEEELLIASPAIDPAISASGEWIAFSRNGDIFRYNISTGDEMVIDSTIGSQRYPSFSPDGAFIAYTSDEDGKRDLIIKSLTGSVRERISFLQPFQPVWSPAGKYVYFLVPKDGIYRLSVSTNPLILDRTQIEKVVNVNGLTNGMFFDVSPDGKTLAITANPLVEKSKNDYSVLEWWQNWAINLDKDK